jgi:hypothetical protein
MGLKEVLGKIWDEAARPVMQGNAEVAQALFSPSGSAFVPYGEGQRSAEVTPQEAPQHGLPPEAARQAEAPQPERGVEMEM